MSATVRIRLLVGAAALLAAGVVAGVVLATRQTPAQPKRQCSTLTAEFFAGAGDPAARPPVRAALANWPRGTVGRLEALARRYPKDPGVLYNYGRALLCAGYFPDAETALEAAKRRGRNTWYEIRADNILHPQYFAGGYPIFQPQRPNALLVRGRMLQVQGHQHSAERVYQRVARLHPGDAEAQVAAAVGRYDEDNLVASFSRLGPLTRRFPQSQSVRFHLGLLLVYTGQAKEALREFRLAYKLGPKTALGVQADALIRKLVAIGSNRTQK